MNYKQVCIAKKASTKSDVAQSFVPGVVGGGIPVVGPIIGAAGTVGGVIGAASDKPKEEDIKKMNEQKHMSLIPGVANHRLAQRRAKQGATTVKNISQQVGWSTSTLLVALASAIAGGAMEATNPDPLGSVAGALKGFAIGGSASLLAHGAGTLAAGLTQTRNKRQQQQYDKSSGSTLANFLIPGYAGYNKYKSYGRLIKDQEQKQKQKQNLA